ncbi:MAG: Hsp33 family molecular chaperone HslO [Bacteriovoracaceae bacterium]
MTPESKLYSFLDNKNSFTIHFLEGQKVIEQMAVLHHLKGAGFSYYRDLLLSVLPFVSFVKKGESFGLYLDSEEPYFRFKLETNYTGNFRTLLLPEAFDQFPQKLTGMVRFSKLFDNSTPYTTIMQVEELDFSQIINQLIRDSYQIEAKAHLSDIVDQSFFISKIPRENVGRYIIDPGLTLEQYEKKFCPDLNTIFAENFTEEKDIVDFFTKRGFYFLGSKPFNYYCPCTRERMITNLVTLSAEDINELFDQNNELEITCDYCHEKYKINKLEIIPN